MRGLRVKPTYEHIKFPNRDASFLRNGFVLSQLDGEGMRAMKMQQQIHIKEVYGFCLQTISKRS